MVMVDNKYTKELIISPPPAARDALPTMATPLLPPSASSAMRLWPRSLPMSAATASAARTREDAAKSRDGGAWHFSSPLQSASPSLSPPPQKSLVCRLVVVAMPLPLVLSTLPPIFNAHQGPVASCPLAPLFPFASRSPAGCRIACCRVPPPRITNSHLTHPSLTPPLHLRQLVVTSHIFGRFFYGSVWYSVP